MAALQHEQAAVASMRDSEAAARAETKTMRESLTSLSARLHHAQSELNAAAAEKVVP